MRSYRLLCPIARALDKVGDRWTLLILRDLHAGPARFSVLQQGLTGLASNLLVSRLRKLQDDGLIRRSRGAHGAQLYELTPEGEATAPLLFELATYGGRFSPPEDIRRPGNLRLIVVTLKEALRRVVDHDTHVHAELVLDAESFAIRIQDGEVHVRYGSDAEAPVSIMTGYEPLIAVCDGDMPSAEFAANHLEVIRGSMAQAGALLALIGRAFGRAPE
ncbi:MAG: DNA-binding HxlR family transcriptional regulator [Bradymonadia bacterium]|jgi:DNA-binding HxlR family transcriptional regulator